MKIATKALATLVLIGMLTLTSVNASAISTGNGATPNQRRNEKKLEKMYQRHDRKLQLRASVLNMSADDLRDQLKARSLDSVIKRHGFKDRQSFYTAVTGKLKDELHRRGWDNNKINGFLAKRLARLERSRS